MKRLLAQYGIAEIPAPAQPLEFPVVLSRIVGPDGAVTLNMKSGGHDCIIKHSSTEWLAKLLERRDTDVEGETVIPSSEYRQC